MARELYLTQVLKEVPSICRILCTLLWETKSGKEVRKPTRISDVQKWPPQKVEPSRETPTSDGKVQRSKEFEETEV